MFHRFRVVRPDSVGEAVALLREHGDGAKVVAGSTAMTIMLRQGLLTPTILVSIAGLEALRTIRLRNDALEIGALATHRDVELSAVVRENAPLLSEAFAKVANVRVRNAATVGGVLAEADYASDPPAALLALDAEILVEGSTRRSVPIAEFFVGFYETVLEPHEIITGVRVPLTAHRGYAYEKFVTRSSEDRPCVAVAALVEVDAHGNCIDARIAVGGATETPLRLPEVEATLRDRPIDPAAAAVIGQAYADAAKPLSDMRGSSWYRREMITVWARRSLVVAAAMAVSRGGRQ